MKHIKNSVKLAALLLLATNLSNINAMEKITDLTKEVTRTGSTQIVEMNDDYFKEQYKNATKLTALELGELHYRTWEHYEGKQPDCIPSLNKMQWKGIMLKEAAFKERQKKESGIRTLLTVAPSTQSQETIRRSATEIADDLTL